MSLVLRVPACVRSAWPVGLRTPSGFASFPSFSPTPLLSVALERLYEPKQRYVTAIASEAYHCYYEWGAKTLFVRSSTNIINTRAPPSHRTAPQEVVVRRADTL